MEHKKTPATLEEMCQRECSARFGQCRGPRVSGLGGYICQGCLEEAKAVINNLEIASEGNCLLCGTSSKTCGSAPCGPVCLSCVTAGLELIQRLKDWGC